MSLEKENNKSKRDIVQKFRRPENLALDACPWTSSFAQACMLLSKHGRPIGHEKDPSSGTEWMLQLILVYARQALNKEYDVDREERGYRTAEVYVNAEDFIEVRKSMEVWEVPKRPSPMQTLPALNVDHVST